MGAGQGERRGEGRGAGRGAGQVRGRSRSGGGAGCGAGPGRGAGPRAQAWGCSTWEGAGRAGRRVLELRSPRQGPLSAPGPGDSTARLPHPQAGGPRARCCRPPGVPMITLCLSAVRGLHRYSGGRVNLDRGQGGVVCPRMPWGPGAALLHPGDAPGTAPSLCLLGGLRRDTWRSNLGPPFPTPLPSGGYPFPLFGIASAAVHKNSGSQTQPKMNTKRQTDVPFRTADLADIASATALGSGIKHFHRHLLHMLAYRACNIHPGPFLF